jgi:hypothetical protein
MRRLLTALFCSLALVSSGARAHLTTFEDWVANTKLGVMLERTETAIRFVIHVSPAWDEGSPIWKARLGRSTFCEDLRRDFPKLTSYTYYVKLVQTLAPNDDIFEFPTTYEHSGSGTAADCRRARVFRGR